MFPLYDDNPTELFSLFTIGIIAARLTAWIVVQGAGFDERAFAGSVCSLRPIPAEVNARTERLAGVRLAPDLDCSFGGLGAGAVFTSMFVHGSWMHLVGNLGFVWIFGNNVEDSMGRSRFLFFYLICGLGASPTHVLSVLRRRCRRSALREPSGPSWAPPSFSIRVPA